MSKNAKFDRAEVVDKACNLYWEKGYHGTSMRNLQSAIDMRPGSIYAAFGSKDNLFIESLNYYAINTGKLLQLCLDESDSPILGLKLFISKIIIPNETAMPSDLCMIVKSISELTDADNKELLDIAKSHLGKVENKIASIIQMAIDQGDIDKHKDAPELARYIQVQIIGLRTYKCINDDAEAINKFINDIFIGSPFY